MKNSFTPQFPYRADIDGLRGISILFVLIFHFFPNLLPGGFIGVDIFFVISGYLIFGIILKEIEANNFSFIDFYSKRVLRLFPSLLLILLFCLSLGWFILLAPEYKSLGKSVASSAAFVGNISAQSSGYFDQQSHKNPLLHLWSLGVEEQFYLICPLILVAIYRLRIHLTYPLLALLLVSFFLNIRGLQVLHEKDLVFYSMPTRFWEILAGGSLNLAGEIKQLSKNKIFIRIKNFKETYLYFFPFLNSKYTSLFGLLLIFIAIIYINENSSFPGWWALLPVIGCMLIIASDHHSSVNTALSFPAIRYLGLISYPLYLWHWPLLVFSKELFLSKSEIWWFKPSILAICLVLSIASYEIFEKPIRFKFSRKPTTVILLIALSLTAITGIVINKMNGFPSRMAERNAFDEYFDNSKPNFKFYYANNLSVTYREECDFYNIQQDLLGAPTQEPTKISTKCYTKVSPQKKSIFIWGDSHAQHLHPGLSRFLGDDWEILQIATSGCNPKIENTHNLDADYCGYSNQFATQKINEIKPDVILISKRWIWNFDEALEINRYLKNSGAVRVIFVGQAPQWLSNLPKIIAKELWYLTPERTWVGVDKNVINQNKIILDTFKKNNLEYIDIISSLCNSNGCLTRIGNDKKLDITTFDYGHLMPKASEHVAQNSIIPAINKK